MPTVTAEVAAPIWPLAEAMLCPPLTARKMAADARFWSAFWRLAICPVLAVRTRAAVCVCFLVDVGGGGRGGGVKGRFGQRRVGRRRAGGGGGVRPPPPPPRPLSSLSVANNKTRPRGPDGQTHPEQARRAA